jgi:hypothetical protein
MVQFFFYSTRGGGLYLSPKNKTYTYLYWEESAKNEHLRTEGEGTRYIWTSEC